jgi:hypothetical protein
MDMIIRTRVFELCDGRYRNLTELAYAMGLSVSQVYRVREGKRGINQKFIIGAKKAFPDYGLDDLFYLDNDLSGVFPLGTSVIRQYQSVN